MKNNYVNKLWKRIGPTISFWVASHPEIKRFILFFLGMFPAVKSMLRQQIYGADIAAPRSMKRDVNSLSPEIRIIYQDLMFAMQKSESEPKQGA